MGSIKRGILGGFSGKVGTVIGTHWKGGSYMRGIAEHIRDPKSKKQLMQRKKFATAIKFLRPLNPYLQFGYKNLTEKQTAMNAAMSYIFQNNCISGEFPEYAIDYTTFKVSLGMLKRAENPEVTLLATTAHFTWTDNSGNANAESNDIAMGLLFNRDKNEAEYDIGNATRMDGELSFSFPSDWRGDHIEVYLAFMSEDEKDVSESSYLGSVEVE